MTAVDLSEYSSIFTHKKGVAKFDCKSYETLSTPSFLEITSDGKSFAIGNTAGDVTILRQKENNDFEKTDSAQRHHGKISDIAFSQSGNLVATCGSERNIQITSFEAESSKFGSTAMKMTMDDSVRAVRFVEDYSCGWPKANATVLLAAVGSSICIADIDVGQEYRKFTGHRGVVTSICMWGGCMFASSSTDKTIRIWDMRSRDSVKIFDALYKPAAVGSTTFQVDSSGRLLYRGDGDGMIHVFDVGTEKKVGSKKVLNRSIRCIRVSTSRRLVLAADNKTLNLSDYSNFCKVPDSCLVSNMSSKIVSTRWHTTRPSFATLDDLSGLKLWELEFNSSEADKTEHSAPLQL